VLLVERDIKTFLNPIFFSDILRQLTGELTLQDEV
jgi:hypothetical protein